MPLYVFCRVRNNKKIEAEIIVQKKGWFGWTNIKTFNINSYSGRIDTTRTYSLTYKGTYRAKFTTTCDGETYSVYSTEEKY